MKKHTVAIGIILFLSTFTTHTQERSLEYEEFNQVLDISHNQVTSEYFICVFKVKIKNTELKYNDVSIWLTLDGKEIAKAQIDEKGNTTLPTLTPEKAERVLLHINQLEKDASISLYTDVAPITSKRVSYRDLFTLLTDMNHFTDVMAGGMSWLIPSLDEIEFSFDKPTTISFNKENDDKQVYESDKANKIKIPFKRAWMRLNPNLEFSDLPIR